MKKLLSIMLCVALLVTLAPTVFAANAVCKQTLSETVWNFSESSDIDAYGTPGNTTNLTTISIVDGAGITGAAGDAAMVISRNDNYNVNISCVSHASTPTIEVSEVATKFSFKVSTKDAMFKHIFRDPTGGDFNAVYFLGGHTYLFGINVGAPAYAVDTWYDVEVYANIPMGYGKLKLKESSASTWKEYCVIANNYTENEDGTATKGLLYGKTATNRLGFGIQGENATVHIDNYYQNEADVKCEFLPSEDFSNGMGSWKTTNVDDFDFLTVGTHDLNGNYVLKMAANEGESKGGKNSNVNKEIPPDIRSKAPLNTNYHFKFKFGGEHVYGSIGASLKTGTNEIFIVKVADNSLRFFSGLVDNTDGVVVINDAFGPRNPETLYEAEAVYNPSTARLTAVVTNAEGKQFIETYTGTTLAGVPTQFAFRNHSVEPYTSVAYFDDFETDFLDTNGPAFVSSDVLSGFDTAAALDETAVFTYDRTINQAALTEAVVTLNNEELSAEEYTITSDGNKVLVTLNDLELATQYTVAVSGVKDIIGNASSDAPSITFTTADTDIIATQPVLNGTTLSTNVTSYYANGKKITLILAVYDSTETTLEKVKPVEFTANNRDGEVVSYDFAEILADAEGKVIKGFVWSDFNTMTPYAEAYHN